MPKRQYTLQYKTITSDWANILSAQQLTSRQYILGFAKGMRQYSLCPELRMIDHQTGEVLEQWEKKSGINHPSKQTVEIGVDIFQNKPYFQIGVQGFCLNVNNPDKFEWYIEMMEKAFNNLGVNVKRIDQYR